MNPYLKLLAANKARGQFKIDPPRAEADAATVWLYDVIVNNADEAEWFGGVAPEPFAKALREIKAGTIHLRINSPGGSVFAARAIEQALREHPAQVVAHIDGYAASAASVVMLGADKIVAAPGAMVMIHNAWTLAMGNADDLKETAALLEKIDGTLAASYAARAAAKANGDITATREQFAQAMAAETWFTAEEAQAAGLVDEVVSPEPAAQARAQAWDLSAYAHAPEPAPAAPNTAALLRAVALREATVPV
jgi:ATP-dependent Clp protease, protease subunit